MQGFVAKAESAKMHGDHHLRAEFTKRLQGLFGIHVHIPFRRRFIGADRKQGQLDLGAFSDFFESVKVSGVATVEDRPSGVFNEKTSEPPVAIVQNARPPVPRGGERDLQRPMFKTLPMAQLMDAVKSESMDKATDMLGDSDRLITRDGTKRATIQMIKMGVSNEDQVDGGKVVKFDSGMFDALDDLQPLRPIRVNENAVLGSLNEEGSMPDPRHADLAHREFGEDRLHAVTVALGEERRDDNFGKKIALVPSFAQPHIHVILRLCALSCSQQSAHHRRGTHSEVISSKKQMLRAKMKEALRSFPEKSVASRKLREHLHNFFLWKAAKIVFGFRGLPEEPDWMGGELPPEKIFAYPRAGDDGTLVFLLASEFETGALGIHEPVGATMAPSPDLVLVPGLAFDTTGVRLGRGKGFYDRWLTANPAVRSVGICFKCQILESLPFEAHDVRVNAIVSEEGVLVP